MPKTVIIIVGPTASGKTALALQLATHLSTDIISSDSRQCFKELNIGVAKPSEKELQLVKHYFINTHSVHDTVTARVFEQYALMAAEEIFLKSQYAIMVGGTGLYMKAFCDGLDEIPQVDGNIRESIVKQYQENGLPWLQQQVKDNDPEFWVVGEQQNPHRLMRALEVKLGAGVSIVSFRKRKHIERPFHVIKIGIDIGRGQLYQNIDARASEMINNGLLAEVQSLLPLRHLNALQTVGYKEFFEYFDGILSLEQAANQLKLNTRHYAKRQLTWFKKDSTIHWKPSFNMAFIDSLIGN